MEVGLLFVAFFGSFNVFPLGEDSIGSADVRIAINMGVTADQFFADAACNVIEVETFLFSGKLSVKDDLQEEVPKFFLQVFLVVSANSCDGFIGFLDEVGNK